MKFMAYIEHDPKSGMYIAQIPALPGAQAKGKNLDDVLKDLQKLAHFCWIDMDEEERKLITEFVGILHLEIS